jgi:flavin reductase (DIM6/NTAB) family NADH-FMN oxidoreductase RutF
VPSTDLPTVDDALLDTELDTATVRRAFAGFPSGVVALIARVDGAPVGLVASSFTVGVSSTPPLVSVAMRRSSATWPLLRRADRIGVSVLAEDQAHLARQLSAPDRARRFDGVDLIATGTGARLLAGAASWFECALHSEVDAGDHTVAFLEVIALGTSPDRPPLFFHGSTFRRLAA